MVVSAGWVIKRKNNNENKPYKLSRRDEDEMRMFSDYKMKQEIGIKRMYRVVQSVARWVLWWLLWKSYNWLKKAGCIAPLQSSRNYSNTAPPMWRWSERRFSIFISFFCCCCWDLIFFYFKVRTNRHIAPEYFLFYFFGWVFGIILFVLCVFFFYQISLKYEEKKKKINEKFMRKI